MKKIGFLCLTAFLLLLYERTSAIDMRKFQTSHKVVEVKGEVRSPGVYEVPWDATVEEILKEAGGCLPDGDTSSLNLSRNIENEGVLVIAKKQERRLVSINSASLEELDELPGIGPSIAQRIIDHRSIQSFQQLEDLKEVKGIGDKLFEKLRELITL